MFLTGGGRLIFRYKDKFIKRNLKEFMSEHNWM